MILNKNSKIEINFFFFNYLIYILFIILNDYIAFFSGSKSTLGTYNLAITLLIIAFLVFGIRNYIYIKPINFSWIDILSIIFFAFMFFIRFLISDNSFDTLNYHILLQENPFADYINFSFFPGRIFNTFIYPLGDRMFYLFRIILGYRLGTILNFYVMIVIYYLLKDFLFIISPEIGSTKRSLLLTITALYAVFSEKLFEIYSVYYIDLLYIPILLELLIVTFSIEKYNNKKYQSIYFALLCGICISFKITNIVFIAVILFIYFFKMYKFLSIKHYLQLFLFAIIPTFVYIINIFLQTGSPIFPFYNKIFKSIYFPEINWVDSRFGAKNIFEVVLWPFIMFFNPSRTDDLAIYSGKLPVAYFICLLWILVSYIKNDKFFIVNKKVSILVAVFLSFTLLWSQFMVGYIRYGLIVEVLAGIIIFMFLFYIHKTIVNKYLNKALLIMTMVFVIFSASIFVKTLVIENVQWSWTYPIYRNFSLHALNSKYLLKDRSSGIDPSLLNNIDAWGIVSYNSAFPILLDPNKPIISLNTDVLNANTQELFNAHIDKYDNIYTVSESNKIEELFQRLNEMKYVVTGNIIKAKPFFINQLNSLYLFKVMPNHSNKGENILITINPYNPSYEIDLTQYTSTKLLFTCYLALHPVAESWGSDGLNTDFSINTNKFFTVNVYNDSEFRKVSFEIDLSEVPKDKRHLTISVSNSENKSGIGDWLAIINPEIIAIK